MKMTRNSCLVFPGKERQITLVLLVLTIMAFTFLGEPLTISAHSTSITTDPSVIIAVDATSASCNVVRKSVNPKTHIPISITHTRCAPGSAITTSIVPLSQARTTHEAYVLPLPLHSSTRQQQQLENQVRQLMKAKRRMLQKDTAFSPTACVHGNQTVDMFGGYILDYDVYVEPWVQYHMSSNCSNLFLDFAAVSGGYQPAGHATNWDEFEYSYFRETCHPNVLIVNNKTYYTYPNATEPAGLTGVFHFGGTACGGPVPTDTPQMYKWVDIGVLN